VWFIRCIDKCECEGRSVWRGNGCLKCACIGGGDNGGNDKVTL